MLQTIIKGIFLIILSVLAGCVMTSRHSSEVTLKGLEFVKANPFEQRFILNINIKNTRSQPLFVRTLSYKLMVNGIFITSGEEFVWRKIPAFSTQQVDILVSTNIWSQLKPLVISIKGSREINYYLTGELRTGSLFYQRVSTIRHSATLTSDQLPKDKLNKLRKKIPHKMLR